jgi:hypothetical protein
LKKETVDCTLSITHFGRGYRPVVRQTTWWWWCDVYRKAISMQNDSSIF